MTLSNSRDTMNLTIPRIDRRGSLPLSYNQIMQLGAWSGKSLTLTLRVEDEINVGTVAAALKEIGRRHEILRTRYRVSFGWQGLTATQIIDKELTCDISLVDISDIPQFVQETEIKKITNVLSNKPFDLTQVHPVRAVIIRTSTITHLLVVVLHHVASDAVSNLIVQREMNAIYKALSSGEPSTLRESPIQYVDYTAWQRTIKGNPPLERQYGYWHATLRDCDNRLQLPTDYPRLEDPRFAWAKRTGLVANSQQLDDFRSICAAEGLTLTTGIVAAFAAWLCRYTGQDTVLFHMMMDGRLQASTFRLMGFMAQRTYIRIDTTPDLTFRQFLNRIALAIKHASANKELPYDIVATEILTERDRSYASQANIMLQLRVRASGSTDSQSTGSSKTERFQRVSGTLTSSNYSEQPAIQATGYGLSQDVSLTFRTNDIGLAMDLLYNVDLFHPRTTIEMFSHLSTLFGAAISDPDQELHQLPLLSPKQRKSILDSYHYDSLHDTSVERNFGTMFSRFTKRAKDSPNRIAIINEDRLITFRKLHEDVDKLSSILQRQGVSAGDRIAIHMPLQEQYIVAILVAHKLGCTFVPTSPSMSGQLLLRTLQESKVAVVLTLTEYSNSFVDVEVPILEINYYHNQQIHEGENTEHLWREDNESAYILSYSSQHAQHKVEPVSHRSLSRTIDSLQDICEINEDDVIAFGGPNITHFEIQTMLWALASGSTMILTASYSSIDELVEVLGRYQVTVLCSTREEMRTLAFMDELEALVTLRHMFHDGYPLSVAVQARIFDAIDVTVHELFAYNKDVGGFIYHSLTRRTEPDPTMTGRPNSQQHAFILDRSNHLSPVGVPGNLCFFEPALQTQHDGYEPLNESKCDFSMAKELDQYNWHGRLKSDGRIEVLGQQSNLLSYKGFQFHCEQFMVALLGCPDVVDAVVLLADCEMIRRPIFHAFVLTMDNSSCDTNKLRACLAKVLPRGVTPFRLSFVDTLPGSVCWDTRVKQLTSYEMIENFIDRPSDIQRVLVDIWKYVLGLEHVGLSNNFFDLGGGTGQAIEMIDRSEEALGIRLSLNAVFRTPRLRDIALLAERMIDCGRLC